jgi:hypothetical protein
MWLRSVSKPAAFHDVWRKYLFAHVSFLIFTSAARKRTRTSTYIHTSESQPFFFHLFSADLGQVTKNSVMWNVSLPAFWTVQISIEDANFDEAWSQSVRVVPHLTTFYHSRALLFSCPPYIYNRILGPSATKRRCQLPTSRPCCTPQRPRVSIEIDTPNHVPHLSPATDPHAVFV